MRGLSPLEIYLLKRCSIWPREIVPMIEDYLPTFLHLMERGLVREVLIQDLHDGIRVRIPETTPMGKLVLSVCVTPV
jgi:hypothetical protein